MLNKVRKNDIRTLVMKAKRRIFTLAFKAQVALGQPHLRPLKNDSVLKCL